VHTAKRPAITVRALNRKKKKKDHCLSFFEIDQAGILLSFILLLKTVLNSLQLQRVDMPSCLLHFPPTEQFAIVIHQK